MKNLLILLLLASFTSNAQWKDLFNGKDLKAWKTSENPTSFRVENGPAAEPPAVTEALGAALAHAETTWAPIHDNSAVLITPGGGHNGFHGQGDPVRASWSDRLVLAWLARLVGGAA
jgi:hypothetical protein